MMPSPANPARNANIPSPITTTPADLKNKGAFFERANEAEPKDRSVSIGNVPRAKESIISIPLQNDPLDSATTCIDCVNPHGRKNVPTPMRMGVNTPCSIFLKNEKILLGRVNLLFLNTPTRLSQRTIMTNEAMSPNTAEKTWPMLRLCPMSPSIPPSKEKPRRRHV